MNSSPDPGRSVPDQPRRPRGGRRGPSAEPRRGSWLAAAGQLQERDQALLQLLHEHTTLTGPQVQALLFPTPGAARARLERLRTQGWLASFHTRRGGRRLPMHWVLGEWGGRWAALHAGDPAPTSRQLRVRNESVAASSQLEHLDGTHEFFVQLITAARDLNHAPPSAPPLGGPAGAPESGRPRVARWWSSARTARAMDGRVRPDGHGVWEVMGPSAHQAASGPPDQPRRPGQNRPGEGAHRGAVMGVQHQVGWFLEYDRATEPLWRLAAKLGPYQDLLADGLAPSWLLLIVVPTARREQNLHAYLDRTLTASNGPYTYPYQSYRQAEPAGGSGLVVLTTSLEHLTAQPLGPAGAVWRRLATTPGAIERDSVTERAASSATPREALADHALPVTEDPVRSRPRRARRRPNGRCQRAARVSGRPRPPTGQLCRRQLSCVRRTHQGPRRAHRPPVDLEAPCGRPSGVLPDTVTSRHWHLPANGSETVAFTSVSSRMLTGSGCVGSLQPDKRGSAGRHLARNLVLS